MYNYSGNLWIEKTEYSLEGYSSKDDGKSMIKRVLCVLAGLFCLLAFCANSEIAKTGLVQESPTEMTEEVAVKLAKKHLSLKNWSWGKPESVREEDGRFYLSYETPERELRIIGARVLVVDKESKLVKVRKRR